MSIQIITNQKRNFGTCNISSFEDPSSLDLFDINVIDFNIEEIWRANAYSLDKLNIYRDIKSLAEMIQNANSAKILICLPQNFDCKYHLDSDYNGRKYFSKSVKLKDSLLFLWQSTIGTLLPTLNGWNPLIFENSITKIAGRKYASAFCYKEGALGITLDSIITRAEGSNKATTFKKNSVYITTLNVTENEEQLMEFLKDIKLVQEEKATEPDWISEVTFYNDDQYHSMISEEEEKIRLAKLKIDEANSALAQNQRFKSILYTNGDQLVDVVFDMLEEIWQCDLSDFQDLKQEDFLVKKEHITFIGEIKGVTSNIKSEFVSQLEVHHQIYLDKLEEVGTEELVKPVLIVNPFKNKPLNQREPIHEKQIALAERYGAIIITTETLYRLYELFQQGLITEVRILQIFEEKSGYVCLDDFTEQ